MGVKKSLRSISATTRTALILLLMRSAAEDSASWRPFAKSMRARRAVSSFFSEAGTASPRHAPNPPRAFFPPTALGCLLKMGEVNDHHKAERKAFPTHLH